MRNRLEVEGLAENRPSVIPNDSIWVWKAGTTDYEYEGKVVAVQKESVVVYFEPGFHEE